MIQKIFDKSQQIIRRDLDDFLQKEYSCMIYSEDCLNEIGQPYQSSNLLETFIFKRRVMSSVDFYDLLRKIIEESYSTLQLVDWKVPEKRFLTNEGLVSIAIGYIKKKY